VQDFDQDSWDKTLKLNYGTNPYTVKICHDFSPAGRKIPKLPLSNCNTGVPAGNKSPFTLRACRLFATWNQKCGEIK